MAEPHLQQHLLHATTDKQEVAVRSLFSSLPLHELLAFLRMRDGKGASRIHAAAAAGDEPMLTALLAAAPDQLQLADSLGRAPLAVAAAHWRPEAVHLLLRQLVVRVGWAARATAAQQALPHVLTPVPADAGRLAHPFALAGTVRALRNAGARPDAATAHDAALGNAPLLCCALRRRQYTEAEALLRQGGARAHVPGASVQPLHALAAGLGRLAYSYADLAPGVPVHPQQVLAVAQLLLLAGARLDEQCGAANLYGVPGLRGATPLGFLCGVAMDASGGGAQLAALALIDLLLTAGASPSAPNQAGNSPLHLATGALYGSSYGAPAVPQPPFAALLHRLLQAGSADLLAEQNAAGYTPLGKLLCCGCTGAMSQALLEGARALLQAGSSLAAAGGGRAWRAVLTAALSATGEQDPWHAAPGAAREQQRVCDELLQLLVGAPGGNLLNAAEHRGMAPLGHLLGVALERQLIAARDSVDYGDTLWQLRPAAAVRLRQLVQQLLRAGARPDALDAGLGEEGAQLIVATLQEDDEDDAELLTDEEDEEEEGEDAGLGAVQRERLRRRWCARRLGTRLELAGACQAPLRQSIKLHDAALTALLLAAGAAPGGGPGRPLLEDAVEEWGLLSHLASFNQDDRREVLRWLLDTGEALLRAGTPPLPETHYFGVAASWSFPWLRLLDHVLAGGQWGPAAHPFYPPAFRAAARTAVLINSTRGFGWARPPRRSPRRSAPAGGAAGVSLPAEVLQRILGLAASPLSL